MKNESPEDRLLDLIKGKRKKPADKPEGAGSSGKTAFMGKVNNGLILPRMRLIGAGSLKTANRTLLVVLFLLTGYMVYDLGVFFTSKEKLADIGQVIEERNLAETDAAGGIGDYSAYSADIDNKDIFSAPFLPEETNRKAPSIDVSKKYNLVGILSGEKPQAIIEDRESEKTHYLFEGQSIDGVEVKKIEEGKVILSFEGTETTLVL